MCSGGPGLLQPLANTSLATLFALKENRYLHYLLKYHSVTYDGLSAELTRQGALRDGCAALSFCCMLLLAAGLPSCHMHIS